MQAYPRFLFGQAEAQRSGLQVSIPTRTPRSRRCKRTTIDLLARGTGLSWPRYRPNRRPRVGSQTECASTIFCTRMSISICSGRCCRTAMCVWRSRMRRTAARSSKRSCTAPPCLRKRISRRNCRGPIPATSNIIRSIPAKAKQILESDGWIRGTRRHPREERAAALVRSHVRGGEQLRAQHRDAAAAAVARDRRRSRHQKRAHRAHVPKRHCGNAARRPLRRRRLSAGLRSADPDDSAIYSGDNLAPHGQNALFWNNPIATAAMNDALRRWTARAANATTRSFSSKWRTTCRPSSCSSGKSRTLQYRPQRLHALAGNFGVLESVGVFD